MLQSLISARIGEDNEEFYFMATGKVATLPAMPSTILT